MNRSHRNSAGGLWRRVSRSRITENVLSLSILRGFEQLVPLLTFPYIIAQVGTTHYGVIAAAVALASLFACGVDFGQNLSGVREVALVHDDPVTLNELAGSILVVKGLSLFFLTLVLESLLAFTGLFSGEHAVIRMAFLITLHTWLMPVWFFQGIERMRVLTYIGILSSLAYIVLLITLVNGEADYWKVPLLRSLTMFIGALAGLLTMYLKFGVRPRFKIGALHTGLRRGWPVMINGFSGLALLQVPVLYVSELSGYTQAGIYAAAQKVICVGKMGFQILTQALYPNYTVRHNRDQQTYGRLWRKTAVALMALGACVYLLLLGAGESIFRAANIDTLITAYPAMRVYGISFITTPAILSLGILALLIRGNNMALAKSQLYPAALFLVLAPSTLAWGGIIGLLWHLLLTEVLIIAWRVSLIWNTPFIKSTLPTDRSSS